MQIATIFLSSNLSCEYLAGSLTIYEKASNAKINLEKSQGFWARAWKKRIDTPFRISWMNKLIEILGIYVRTKTP